MESRRISAQSTLASLGFNLAALGLCATTAWACGGGASDGSEGDPGSTASSIDVGADASAPGDVPNANANANANASANGAPATAADADAGALAAAAAVPAPAPVPLPFRGVNLSGAEFGTALPGTDGIDYRWPTSTQVAYYLSKGANSFRVGFQWERLQPAANGAFAAPYFAELDALVTDATSKGANIIIEPHNFARYYGNIIGSAAVPVSVFANLWSQLALHFAGNPHVVFNLVNEPHDMPTEQWVAAANGAIAAIRATGATNLLIVPGNGWTGAYSWATSNSYGTANAVAMLGIVDPANHFLYEVHQYLDADASGVEPTCVSATIGSERLAPFIAWLRANGKKGFVGEFAGGDNAMCHAAVTDMLVAMRGAADVLEGWTWWGGGQWGSDYVFSVEPLNNVDRPLLVLLAPFFTAP